MPTDDLRQMRDEIVTTLRLDERVRGVEIEQASQGATLVNLDGTVSAMRDESRRDKAEVLAAIETLRVSTTSAIEAARPKPWPVVSALSALAGVLLVLAAVLYGQPPA